MHHRILFCTESSCIAGKAENKAWNALWSPVSSLPALCREKKKGRKKALPITFALAIAYEEENDFVGNKLYSQPVGNNFTVSHSPNSWQFSQSSPRVYFFCFLPLSGIRHSFASPVAFQPECISKHFKWSVFLSVSTRVYFQASQMECISTRVYFRAFQWWLRKYTQIRTDLLSYSCVFDEWDQDRPTMRERCC